MPEDVIELRAGALELAFCPKFGGSIVHFRHRGRDLMRPAGLGLLEHGDVRTAACFPLVPFSGRIADARFRFAGREFHLEPNFPPEPHAIHGQGWRLPWRVVHASEQRVELGLEHAVPATPLCYRASQRFGLASDGLDVEIGLTNAGAGPMPAGIGLHPYFLRTAGVTLQTWAQHVWLTDERKIPRERVPLPETWDFANAPRLAPLTLDNCFDGWSGKAILLWPELALRLTIEADPVFGHLVVYVPADKDFFCVEPVSHAANGFNLLAAGADGTGVRVLEPDETLTGVVRFTLA